MKKPSDSRPSSGRLLDALNLPQDLRTLNAADLRRLAEEIRSELIGTVSRRGGHLGPSLGVVELTLALHAELDSPADKIVWDVGHQAYAHKLLTGRLADFASIRTFGGLSGFPRRSESPHDCFGTGHSSTSVSVGAGLAEAARMASTEARVVAVIGDGALTGGMAYEGLNHAGHLKTPLVVVLNDNGMSIKRNVGAMSSYLSRLRSQPALYRLRRDVEKRVQRFPAIGEAVAAVGEQLKDGVKAALVPGMLFEELGFTYLGVTDGHDIEALRRDLRHALAVGGPVVLHIKTVKGKGYGPAEEQPARFHGISPFHPGTGKTKETAPRPVSYTESFGRALVTLAGRDRRILGITAAMAPGTGLDLFEERFPDRFFDVGIAEGHAVGFAGGLAAEGFRPVVAVYSTFLQRAYDQLIHDVCLQELPVVFALDRAGLVGEDGPTHHGAFDISFLRCVPNLSLYAPKDEAELQHLLATALAREEPAAVRYPRGAGLGVPLPDLPQPLTGPWAEVLSEGSDLLVIATGSGVAHARRAVQILDDEGIKPTLVNLRRIWPLPLDELLPLLEQHQLVVTVEENVLAGGMGAAVLEALAETGPARRVERVGLPNRFVPHGDVASLHRWAGLDPESIAERIRSVCRSPSSSRSRVRESGRR